MASVSTAVHAALVEDLRRVVAARLVDPLAVLVEDEELVAPVRRRVEADAQMWAAQLLGRDQERAAHTAARLVGLLYPGDEAFDPPEQWWRTPLGGAVARTLGHTAKQRVTFAEAGAMLGITRQGVHDLARRGKLVRHPDGGVTSASVRDRAAARPGGPEAQG
ncbi:hypothetical protein [Nocardiopsis coralliicola]